MRLIFMGTPDFSVPVLESLYHAGHEILAVVTQPDKPKGRGKAILMTPVKEKALELGLTVYQPARVREPEFVEILKGLKPELMVVVAFGQILILTVFLFHIKYSCFSPSGVPWLGSDSVGHLKRREGDRSYNHDDGCRSRYRRYAGADGDPHRGR